MKARPVSDEKPKAGQDEKNRTILVCGVLLLTIVTLILYAITRDTALLLTSSSVLGTCILSVPRYFFRTE